MIKKFYILLSLIILLTSCANNVQRYYPAPDLSTNLQEKFNNKKIKLKILSVSNQSNFHTTCRLISNIVTPKKESFSSYIKNALSMELKRAKLYSDISGVGIKIQINEMNFNSFPGLGKWYYNISVYSDNEDFIVESTYNFSTDVIPGKACYQVANAFQGSLEQLFLDITDHPRFQNL